jgi:SapC
MASAPQAAALPLFYKDLMPLNSRDHANYRTRTTDKADWMVGQHAVPLTAEEFIQAGRFYPIVFSVGDNPVPLALMGLNEGVNAFLDDEGKFAENVYVPAYVRRYPYMLAKLTPDTDDLSLCFDPTCDLIGEFDDGVALFEGDQASESCRGLLEFCKNFEEAGQKTGAFVEELEKHNLLMEGEVSIQQPGLDQPFVYRGFKMVDQEKLRDLRGDQLRTWNQSGLLPLDLIREVFGRQVQLGKGPVTAAALAAATPA